MIFETNPLNCLSDEDVQWYVDGSPNDDSLEADSRMEAMSNHLLGCASCETKMRALLPEVSSTIDVAGVLTKVIAVALFPATALHRSVLQNLLSDIPKDTIIERMDLRVTEQYPDGNDGPHYYMLSAMTGWRNEYGLPIHPITFMQFVGLVYFLNNAFKDWCIIAISLGLHTERGTHGVAIDEALGAVGKAVPGEIRFCGEMWQQLLASYKSDRASTLMLLRAILTKAQSI